MASGTFGADGQLPLDLPHESSFAADDFLLSTSNEKAFALIDAWPDWPSQTVLLAGPVGSGKSHLAHIWANRAGAPVLSAAEMAVTDIRGLAEQRAILVEDAHNPQMDQTALFHLINAIRGLETSLLVTSRIWPQSWREPLPDLVSRLRQATMLELSEPDDVLLSQVLVKLFADRQIVVESSVIRFIVARMERSLQAASEIVSLLDKSALAAGRRITRPWAADVLNKLGKSSV